MKVRQWQMDLAFQKYFPCAARALLAFFLLCNKSHKPLRLNHKIPQCFFVISEFPLLRHLNLLAGSSTGEICCRGARVCHTKLCGWLWGNHNSWVNPIGLKFSCFQERRREQAERVRSLSTYLFNERCAQEMPIGGFLLNAFYSPFIARKIGMTQPSAYARAA